MTVVVDFDRLGGGEQTRCAPGDPASGVAALRGAGFEPTRAAQEAGYFVCRIDGRPADDPCQRASPEDAYWSYWHAQPGGSWTFSNTGAADHDPAPGTVEGWAFGAGDPPSSPPPARQQAQPPAARPTPPTSPPPPQRSPAPAAAATAPALAAASTVPVETARATATPSERPSALPTPRATPTAPATASEEPTLTVDDPAAADEGSSPLAGVLLAVAVVAGLGAAAAYQAQRRR